ncbi:MAG TPA: winged helix DNA-binding domain-containing protein [Streptosporangiaceae bacterium]|nr:winged helix DNA-binding domain-containing protein [Streptosporangiaceae bacterium]
MAAHLGGLQAQAAPPARMAVRPRTAGLTAAAVDQACADRDVTRTWAMRGTLHLVATADVRWMTALLGPVFVRKDRGRRAQLGLDDQFCEQALAVLASILAGSIPLTRAELVGRLAAEGIRIDPRTQQPPHLLGYAAGRGLICRGPDRPGEEPTYVLLDEWAPDAPALSRDEALAELARRYLGGYGPAARADFARWSGLPAADTKRAWELIAAETVPVTGAGAGLTALAGAELAAELDHARLDGAPPRPRLLGHFDPWLLGYHDRHLVLDPAWTRRIQAGGGFLLPVVVAGGQVTGTWRLDRRAARLAVAPFAPLTAATRDALAGEATDVGRFFDVDVTFEVAVPS